jgi:hypothetical protein
MPRGPAARKASRMSIILGILENIAYMVQDRTATTTA